MGAPREWGTCGHSEGDTSGDSQRAWRAPGVGVAHGSGATSVVAANSIPLDMAMEDGADGAVHAPPNGGACGLRYSNATLELRIALEGQGTVQDEQVGLDRNNKLGLGRGGKGWSPSKATPL